MAPDRQETPVSVTPATGCFACEVNAGIRTPPGGTIFEDQHWVADHEVTPLVRGFVILKPRRHVHQLADLDDDAVLALGPAMQTVLRAMRQALTPELIYVCSFAETVHHLHFHLVPRYSSMPGLGPDLVPGLFAGQWACTIAEAEEAADLIRSALSN